jgi:HK97 family phage major capsid protein
MKLNELKQDLNEKIERLNKLVVTEERSLTSDQETEFDNVSKEVETLKRNIERLEKLEVENKSRILAVKENSIVTPNEFSICKFIREAYRGGLSGRELEAHNEAERNFRMSGQAFSGYGIPLSYLQRVSNATVTSSNETNLLKVNQKNDISFLPSPAYQLIEKLGITVYSDLTGGKFDIPYSNQLSAVEVGLGASNSGATFAPGKETLAPRRFQISIPYSLEYLAQINPATEAKVRNKMLDAIYVAALTDLLKQVTGNTTVVSGTTSAYTWANILAMQAKIESSSLNAFYVTNTSDASTLKSTIKSGSTYGFIAENGEIDGKKLVATSLAPSSNVIYGDFGFSCLGFWNGISILVDPYGSNASKGEVTVHVTALLDAGVENPYAFTYQVKA